MSVGLKYFSALLYEGDVERFISSYLFPEMFRPFERKIFDFVNSYVEKYGILPSQQLLTEQLHIEWPEYIDTSEFYLEQVIKQYMGDSIRSMAEQVNLFLQQGNPDEALKYLSNTSYNILAKLHQPHVANLDDMKRKLYNKYDHKSDVLFGWGSLDKQIGILEPGLISLVARSSLGKTFCMLYMALHMYKHMQKVMFVNIEMTMTVIYERIISLLYAINLSKLQSGGYKKEELELIFEKLDKDYNNFIVIDGSFTLAVSDIVALAKQYHPNVIFIDGAYLLHGTVKSHDRTHRVSNVAEQIMQQIVRSMNIPVVCSWQFNREASKVGGDKVDLEHIGLSDTIGQLSRIVLGIVPDDSIGGARSRRIKILKGSSGEIGEFYINFIFDDNGINLTEISDVSDLSIDL